MASRDISAYGRMYKSYAELIGCVSPGPIHALFFPSRVTISPFIIRYFICRLVSLLIFILFRVEQRRQLPLIDD